MTAQYRLFETDEIIDYLREQNLKPELVAAQDRLSCAEVSDGNLNRVFLARDDSGAPGIAIKQALPWLRVGGEGWPLTPERAVIEARTYDIYRTFAPEYVPEIFDFNRDRYIIAMEDLGKLRVWREVLTAGEVDLAVPEAIGTFVARVGYHTSEFGIGAPEKKLRAAECVNPALCQITEDVVLSEPYIEHENNRYLDQLAPLVAEVRRDEVLRTEVAALRHTFMTHSEALVHGDLHSGSIMVDAQRVAVIDPEFAYYGPLGFDLGVFWGNCVIAAVRAEVLGVGGDDLTKVHAMLAASWRTFLDEWQRWWPQRRDQFFTDAYGAQYLRKVWSDGLGFAGTEAMRRVIGYAHVEDLTSLPLSQQAQAAAATARICRQLIIQRHRLFDPMDITSLIKSEVNQAAREHLAAGKG